MQHLTSNLSTLSIKIQSSEVIMAQNFKVNCIWLPLHVLVRIEVKLLRKSHPFKINTTIYYS